MLHGMRSSVVMRRLVGEVEGQTEVPYASVQYSTVSAKEVGACVVANERRRTKRTVGVSTTCYRVSLLPL